VGAGVCASGRRNGGRAICRAALVVALGACGEAGPPPRVELDDGPVELAPTVEVHEVAIRRDGDGPETIAPDVVLARAGDVVRFTSQTLDSHALAFRASRLDPEQLAFLVRTGQEASAPILARGNAWVLSLEGAPPGTYPLMCLIHEAAARVDVTGGP
jgi:plastocyanin